MIGKLLQSDRLVDRVPHRIFGHLFGNLLFHLMGSLKQSSDKLKYNNFTFLNTGFSPKYWRNGLISCIVRGYRWENVPSGPLHPAVTTFQPVRPGESRLAAPADLCRRNEACLSCLCISY